MKLASSAAPEAARPIAVLMSRFPALTETFILRELVELERSENAIELVPLLRETPPVVHPEAAPWDARAHYTPFLSGAIVRANAAVFLSQPGVWLGTLARLLWEARASWNAWIGALGIYPKSVYYGQLLRALGVRHVHAHYATHPATAAYVISRVRKRDQAELPYSVTIHAHDIFIHTAGLARKLGGAVFLRTISAFNRDYLLARIPLEPRRFRVIHCGIEPERYRAAQIAGVPLVERPARIFTVASLQPYKGLRFLIEALRMLRERGLDVTLEVAGEGELRPELEAQIAAAGLAARARLLGRCTQAEVAEKLATSDLFVLPSIVEPTGKMEGIPVALMEALAAGVPVVASRLSGIPELVIPGRTGALVEPEDAAGLAAAIEAALRNPERARAEARVGQDLVRREFEIRGCVAALVRAINGD